MVHQFCDNLEMHSLVTCPQQSQFPLSVYMQIPHHISNLKENLFFATPALVTLDFPYSAEQVVMATLTCDHPLYLLLFHEGKHKKPYLFQV